MEQGALLNIFVFLVAACAVVPLAGKFRLGSVLGYLVAGIAIGPFGIGLIHNPERIMHFAEFGVVMMLFLIGLELEPPTLWKLRKLIVGLGGVQVLATTATFCALGMMLGFEWQVALSGGMALSLSSTALVLQMLEEKGLMNTSAGESSFAVLLFQDIAVIPVLILLPLMAGSTVAEGPGNLLSGMPGWLHALVVAGIIALIVLGGRTVSRHLFRFIAKTNLREIFTATSLALVIGITLLMQAVGVSPALGAFVAGVVLANSEYRRTLETDIQPFKGLLLGLFFISVGMGMDFGLLAAQPVSLLSAVLVLVAVKAILLFAAGRWFGLRGAQNTLFALALAQGGEFAFVLFQYTLGLAILSAPQAAFLTLTVALSMAVTPFLMIFNDRFIVPRFMSALPPRDYDAIDGRGSTVIIAGYGRFGQIIGRFLSGQGVRVTVLEKDPDQIELLRKFTGGAFFGDASRLDLLANAGAAGARLLVVAVDDADKCLEIVKLARQHFPKLHILARARNRRHAYELDRAGVDYFRRETFDSALAMAQEAMVRLGADKRDMRIKAQRFLRHDEKTLRASFAFFEREPELIDFARQASGELERILQADAHVPLRRTHTTDPATLSQID